MNEALRMQISAFVDGELPDNESELLLRRLSQDAVLRQQVGHELMLNFLNGFLPALGPDLAEEIKRVSTQSCSIRVNCQPANSRQPRRL